MRIRIAAVIFSTLLGWQQAGTQAAHDRWTLYTNVRFQYALCYPKDLFVARGETDNSAGNTFEGKHGKEIIVDGENTDRTLSQLRKETVQYVSDHFGPVQYQAMVAHGFVFSASNTKDILYGKTFLSGKQYKTFSVTYPLSEKEQFDPVVKGLNTCFTDLNSNEKVTFPH